MFDLDKEMTPVSIIYNPKSVPSQPFVKWFQKEYADAYQQMKEGVIVKLIKSIEFYQWKTNL